MTLKDVLSRITDEDDQDVIQWHLDELQSVLDQLDHLAKVWGDEGVFRRCRDRLRALLK